MPNFTLSEILTIALVILIVFGPQRLPEMAQKAGQWVRKGRTMITDLRQEFEGEWGEVTQPLKEVTMEVKGIKDDMGTSLASLTDDVTQAKKDLEEKLAETTKETNDEATGPKQDTTEPKQETTGGDAEPPAAADPPAEAGGESSSSEDDS